MVAYFERATAELAYRARRDPLTGLLNHHAFWGDLDRELARAERYGHGLTFVVVDLDHFKSVNDTRGHPVGDRVLRCMADALGAIARSSDLVARVGGDEFAVALVETDATAGEAFIERLRGSVEERCAADDLSGDGGFSAGVARFPTDAATAAALFELADSRLYDRKRARA